MNADGKRFDDLTDITSRTSVKPGSGVFHRYLNFFILDLVIISEVLSILLWSLSQMISSHFLSSI